jgi:hypothetical protein
VQREYNGKTYLDVKDARVNQPYKERNTGGGDAF